MPNNIKELFEIYEHLIKSGDDKFADKIKKIIINLINDPVIIYRDIPITKEQPYTSPYPYPKPWITYLENIYITDAYDANHNFNNDEHIEKDTINFTKEGMEILKKCFNNMEKMKLDIILD